MVATRDANCRRARRQLPDLGLSDWPNRAVLKHHDGDGDPCNAAGAPRWSAIGAFARTNYRTGLLAGVLSVAGYLAFLAAAQVLPLAPVSALRESSVIFGAVIGATPLREGFAVRRIAAAVMVTCGVAALALAGGR